MNLKDLTVLITSILAFLTRFFRLRDMRRPLIPSNPIVPLQELRSIVPHVNYGYILLEFDPVRVRNCIETPEEHTCRDLASEFESFVGTLPHLSTTSVAMFPARSALFRGRGTMNGYADLVNAPNYAPVDRAMLRSTHIDWRLLAGADHLFHIVRSRPGFARQSGFWREYILAGSGSLALMRHFVKVCAYADLIRETCDKASLRTVLDGRPNREPSRRVRALRRRCSEGNDDWWAVSLEVDQHPSVSNARDLRRLALTLLWNIAADIPDNIQSVKWAASLIPSEFQPEAYVACQECTEASADCEAKCTGLLSSFLDRLGLNSQDAEDKQIPRAVMHTLFSLPKWDRFLSMRASLISQAEIVANQLNEKLLFYKLPAIPIPEPSVEASIAPLRNVFATINSVGPSSLRTTFWREYFHLDRYDRFYPLALLILLEANMLKQLLPALYHVCDHFQQDDSWTFSDRLMAFKHACRHTPEEAHQVYALFTTVELEELIPIVISWNRPADVRDFFQRTIERLLRFDYVQPDRLVDSSDCSVCLGHPDESLDAAFTPCGHQFCVGCLYQWLEVHSSCPNCRQSLPPPS